MKTLAEPGNKALQTPIGTETAPLRAGRRKAEKLRKNGKDENAKVQPLPPVKTSKKRETHPERFQTFAELGSKTANTPAGARRVENRQRHRWTPEKHTTNCLAEMQEQNNERTRYDHNPFL